MFENENDFEGAIEERFQKMSKQELEMSPIDKNNKVNEDKCS